MLWEVLWVLRGGVCDNPFPLPPRTPDPPPLEGGLLIRLCTCRIPPPLNVRMVLLVPLAAVPPLPPRPPPLPPRIIPPLPPLVPPLPLLRSDVCSLWAILCMLCVLWAMLWADHGTDKAADPAEPPLKT